MHFSGPDQNVFIHWTLSDWLATGARHFFSCANAFSIESSSSSSVFKMNKGHLAGFTDISSTGTYLIIAVIIRDRYLKSNSTYSHTSQAARSYNSSDVITRQTKNVIFHIWAFYRVKVRSTEHLHLVKTYKKILDHQYSLVFFLSHWSVLSFLIRIMELYWGLKPTLWCSSVFVIHLWGHVTLTLWLRSVTPADLKSGNLMPAVSGTAWRRNNSLILTFILNFGQTWKISNKDNKSCFYTTEYKLKHRLELFAQNRKDSLNLKYLC